MAVFEVEVDVVAVLREIPETVQRRDALRETIRAVGSAEVRVQLQTFELGLEDDVDDTCDGVRAIDGGGAVFEHFDALDDRQRER